jgi:4a-hydroxytetrahydrobiopterin dehydratase|tara:strand:+ start:296 stop:625 length:330 start_codon:yes stop_codon:yes gene_type:complete
MSLKESKCEACTIDAPLVSESEAKVLLLELDGWVIENDSGINQLIKTYKFSNYAESLDFSNKVADLAESEDHHPKIVLEYGSVEVSWWSHKIKGLHKNDFICAAKTDLI